MSDANNTEGPGPSPDAEETLLEDEGRRTILIAAVIVSLVALGYVAVLLVGGRALRDLPFAKEIQGAGERIGEVVGGRQPAVALPPPLQTQGPVAGRPSPTPVVAARPTLSPSVEPPAPDEPSLVTFTIEYENTTGVRLTGVQITDDIPGGATYRNGSASPPATFDGRKLTWNIGTLDPGQKGAVSFQVFTNRKGRITNEAVMTSNEAPSSKITTSATVT